MKNGDEIIYTLKLKNIGILTTDLRLWNKFPYGLDISEIEINKNNTKEKIESENSSLNIRDELDTNQELTLTVKAKVNKEKYSFNQEYIENSFEISGSKIDKMETNVISFKIIDNKKEEIKENESGKYEFTQEELEKFEKYKEVEENRENLNNNNPEKPNDKVEQNNDNNNVNNDVNNDVINKTKGKYSISGKAWLDSNKNGKYDLSEEKLKNINIRLYKSSNGTSVVYSSNNLVSKTVTDGEGNYKFENLEDGYYLVMAEYNSENYNLSEYKAEYAGESSNSDFITKNTKIDGKDKTVAISDILQVNSSNIGSIDLGLTEKDECDIEIKKTVSSITLVDDKGKQTINYKDDEIVKLDVAAKKIGKTKATIIYEFAIKNNGDIDTYITNIVDYLPEGLKFDEKVNTGWYLSEGNKVSNLSLANTKIEAGKTKKLKLALTVDISDDALGSYINEVEVLETTNDKKLAESNLENNKAKVELLITIKTGDVILYLSLIVIGLSLMVGIILIIKKKLIKPVYK